MAVVDVVALVIIELVGGLVVVGVLVEVVVSRVVVLVDKENKALTEWELLSDKL